MIGRNVCRVAFVCFFIVGSAPLLAQGSPDHGDILVSIAPCRILDTSAPPALDAGASRKIDVRSSRCARIVPPFATAYAVRVTRVSRQAPEKLPPGVGPVTEAVKKVPVPADGRMTFPAPPDDVIGADVVGYYVPAGTPVSPRLTSSGAEGAATLKADAGPGEAPTSILYSGDLGNIFLNGGWWSASGVAMVASAAAPYITSNLGNNNGASAFVFSNTTNEMMRIRSDGAIYLPPNSFVDGRTDFFGTPGSYAGYVSIPTNVVHDVTLVNPYDAAGGNASRVTFFNAFTYDENGSPPLTKFAARTGGYFGQENVNFDSSFHWHQPNQYHFRAVSTVENKNTFWVKAATSLDSVTQTRADMYVSGRVGIGPGTTVPSVALEVNGGDLAEGGVKIVNNNATHSSGINFHTGSLSKGYVGWRGASSTAPFNAYGMYVVNTDNSNLILGTNNLERLRIDTNGNIGIGMAPSAAKLHVSGNIVATGSITGATVIGATYQDLAEWVSSSSDMLPGTVVVLNTAANNEVMASVKSYDTAVAGVVSAQPGVLLGVAGAAKEMIATTGRVRVKVDATDRPILIGDLLVTSSNPGMAMKSIPVDIAGLPFHRPGTIIGKALEPLASGQGEILVLLSMQ